MIQRLELKNFTVFESLEIDFSPGVNIFIGENGTGKTHVLKLMYAIVASLQERKYPEEKIANVFLPQGKVVNRLVRAQCTECENAEFSILTDMGPLWVNISRDTKKRFECSGFGIKEEEPLIGHNFKTVYIPVKEMLANAQGFRSLYDQREVAFEEVYFDIISKAFVPELRDKATISVSKDTLVEMIRVLGGPVGYTGESFFILYPTGPCEFTLVAEGIRKIALLWLLLHNATLREGSILFWDEPEANLNPKLMVLVVTILLELERAGVQIFIATHSYSLLKEFDLQRKEHALRYYALYKDEEGRVLCNPSDSYLYLHPNAIAEHADRIYDLEIELKFGSRS